jgi:hypothetical protein
MRQYSKRCQIYYMFELPMTVLRTKKTGFLARVVLTSFLLGIMQSSNSYELVTDSRWGDNVLELLNICALECVGTC